MQGKELCRRFFEEAARPLLKKAYPALSYTAGITGYGSDVLGYDDEVSQDHMWGPRFYLFLKPEDMEKKEALMELFSTGLPKTFWGYPVNFSEPDPNDNGIRHACQGEGERVSPLIFVNTLGGFLTEYLGHREFTGLTCADWLAMSENRLLIMKKSEFWVDGLGMKQRLEPLEYYPEPVWSYLIASVWEHISQEQAFVKRCASRGDDLGSRLCCARIGEGLIRLCFLYCKVYAPYSKWFGTAFRQLPVWESIPKAIETALSTGDMLEREHAIALAQKLVCDFQDRLGLMEPVKAELQPYFGRDIQVIFADSIAQRWADRLKGTQLEGLPLVGSFSMQPNLVCLYEDAGQQKRRTEFYKRY